MKTRKRSFQGFVKFQAQRAASDAFWYAYYVKRGIADAGQHYRQRSFILRDLLVWFPKDRAQIIAWAREQIADQKKIRQQKETEAVAA